MTTTRGRPHTTGQGPGQPRTLIGGPQEEQDHPQLITADGGPTGIQIEGQSLLSTPTKNQVTKVPSTNVEPRNCPHPDIAVLVEVVVEDSPKRDVILVNPSVADNNMNV